MKSEINEDIFYVQQFIGGEEQGFKMLVNKYQNNLLNLAYSLTGYCHESEDIVQEVFFKVYRNLKFFKQRCRFSTWLYRITVNTSYDFLRRKRIFKSREGSLVDEIADNRNNPREKLLEKQREDLLNRALSKVPFKYRAALIFKDIEGLSYVRIARVLHCRIGTVESRIYRARQILKKELLKHKEDII
ncbi:MAG: sigma-70 family RNA polymerase sigma factor [Candidatus Omnitrophica bacterium]|nr:sigma-70 family RNA polymerase sigma factor [Candidatus Omnitrophota bacterium]